MENFSIEPLSLDTLEAACALANGIWPDEKELPEVAIRGSLDTEKYAEVFAKHHVIQTNYWVAIQNKKVLGIIGLYEHDFDANEAAWIGWYCVQEKQRGSGVGSALLAFVTDEAKRRKKKFLRVYTSTSPVERVALEMYQRKGFQITKRTPQRDNENIETINLERILTKNF